MKKISFIIKEDAKNLLEATKQIGLSRNMFNRYAYLGRILVNEKENRRNDRIYKNDRITFLLEDENIKYQKKALNDDVELVYSDELIYILKKPDKMLCHPSKNSGDSITLEDYAKNYFVRDGINHQVRFINRLDYDTTGLVMIAKNDIAHAYYAQKIKNSKIKRQYLALAEGDTPPEKWKEFSKIDRDKEIGIKTTLGENGKDSETHFNLLYTNGKYHLIKAGIITGRTHQIRLHLGAKNLQIANDPLYGKKDDDFQKMMLLSYYTEFENHNSKLIKIAIRDDYFTDRVREIFRGKI